MDLESITLYLATKHIGAVEIHSGINNILGEGTVGHPTITQYWRKQSSPDSSERANAEPEIGSSDLIESAKLQPRNEQPLPSLRQLAKRILIPMTTIRHDLVNKMGDKIKHCK
jgi:hypothetical protein